MAKKRLDKSAHKKVYKVWVEIEEYDEVLEEGETLDSPGSSVATFDTYDEAWDFAERLQAHGEGIGGKA